MKQSRWGLGKDYVLQSRWSRIVCYNPDGEGLFAAIQIVKDCVLQSGWWRIVCCNPDGGGFCAAFRMVEDCVL